MKKYTLIIIGCLVLALGVGLAVAAELQTREDAAPEETVNEYIVGADQTEETGLWFEVNMSEVVLTELDLPVLDVNDLTLEDLQAIVELANEIYENCETVVLSDQVITTDQRCAEGREEEVTYTEYCLYERALYNMIKELLFLSFSAEVHVATDDIYDRNYSNVNLEGDYFFFDLEQSDYENATEWMWAWYHEGSDASEISKTRILYCFDDVCWIEYRDFSGELIKLSPTEEQREISSYLCDQEIAAYYQEVADFMGLSYEEYMEYIGSDHLLD